MSTQYTKGPTSSMYTRSTSKDSSTEGQVSLLQRFLKDEGFLGDTIAISGYYGSLTRNAVIAFQTAHGLVATGATGPLTRTKIQEVSCSSSEVTSGGSTISTHLSTSIPQATVTTADTGTSGAQLSVAGTASNISAVHVTVTTIRLLAGGASSGTTGNSVTPDSSTYNATTTILIDGTASVVNGLWSIASSTVFQNGVYTVTVRNASSTGEVLTAKRIIMSDPVQVAPWVRVSSETSCHYPNTAQALNGGAGNVSSLAITIVKEDGGVVAQTDRFRPVKVVNGFWSFSFSAPEVDPKVNYEIHIYDGSTGVLISDSNNVSVNTSCPKVMPSVATVSIDKTKRSEKETVVANKSLLISGTASRFDKVTLKVEYLGTDVRISPRSVELPVVGGVWSTMYYAGSTTGDFKFTVTGSSLSMGIHLLVVRWLLL
ncbi:MAG: putative peptidoglycan binding domain [Candidatus Parcubacteria bacterium]|jgi:peptidoglycan hydrolase-like protein with peptidoglycan-binding domain